MQLQFLAKGIIFSQHRAGGDRRDLLFCPLSQSSLTFLLNIGKAFQMVRLENNIYQGHQSKSQFLLELYLKAS